MGDGASSSTLAMAKAKAKAKATKQLKSLTITYITYDRHYDCHNMITVQALSDNVIKLFFLSSSLTIERNKLECLTGSGVRLGHT